MWARATLTGNWWQPKRRLSSTAGLLYFACALLIPVSMTAAPRPILEKTSYASIAGWAGARHEKAFAAFRRSCAEIIETGRAFERPIRFGGARGDWLEVCEKTARADQLKSFFEANFTPLRVFDPVRPEGLFTGYFEPEANGSLEPDKTFTVPIYGRPADLQRLDETTAGRVSLRYGREVGGKPQGYFTRREIEEGALQGRGLEIVWLADWADAFFMQVQGSGRVRLPDGSLMRLAYAAKSGQPYTGIGGLLVERGTLSRDDMSMQAIRAWMKDHPKEARELMWENKSYVFFRKVEIDDPELGPPGAQKVALTPLASLAVDRSLWAFGTPVWLDTAIPVIGEASLQPFRSLMIAQDTGTAIKGYARGDVFWGVGEAAAFTAGHMKSSGNMTVLLPHALAQRLLAEP
jgi:membrane-bound lytic murein transglycosylase A